MYVDFIIMNQTVINVMIYIRRNSKKNHFNYKVIKRINRREEKGLERYGLIKLWGLIPE